MRFLNDEQGASALESGLLAAGLAVMVMVGASSFGNSLSSNFEEIGNALSADGVLQHESTEALNWDDAPAALKQQRRLKGL